MAARLHYCFLIPFLNNLRSCLRHEVPSRRLMHVEMLSSRETGMNRTTDLPGAEKQHRTDPPCWRYDASGLHPSCASSTTSLPSLSLSSALASCALLVRLQIRRGLLPRSRPLHDLFAEGGHRASGQRLARRHPILDAIRPRIQPMCPEMTH